MDEAKAKMEKKNDEEDEDNSSTECFFSVTNHLPQSLTQNVK